MAARSAGIAIGIGIGAIAVGFIVAYNSGSLGSISEMLSETSGGNAQSNISQEETKMVSGVEVKSFTTTSDSPTELKILDNEVFVLDPQTSKTYEFTLDNPSYPIKVSGDMTVTDHNEKVTFAIQSKDTAFNIASMTTSPDYIKAKIGKFYAGMNEDYVHIESYQVLPKDRDNPTFYAVFTNDGDIEQEITANLQFTYG